ncbi:exonuclease II Exo2, partial [Coemansia sp. IMI 209127]
HLKSNDDLLTAEKCFEPANSSGTLTVAETRSHIDAEVKRVKQWLKTNVSHDDMIQLPIESELLSKGQIDAIAAMEATKKHSRVNKVVVRDVHREAALLPAHAPYLLQSQSLMVGHRIAYIADRSGSVPFGAKGYIVGIHARKNDSNRPAKSANNQHIAAVHQEGLSSDKISMVEILLDKPFIDGTSLDGRCAPYRGALVRPHQVLDLTSWGLGQNVTNRPTANPRVVDVIKPAPDVAKGSGVAATKTAAKVSVREPAKAPWADSKGRGNQAQASNDHANQIMTQLKTKLAASSQKASTSGGSSFTAQSVAAKEPRKETHAQDIISTLLAGPMAKVSIGGSGSTSASGKTNAPSTVLYAHPSVSGQYPLVIEDEYLSDSMDEASDEDVGAPRAGGALNSNNHQVHYNYGTNRGDGTSSSRGNGRGRGQGRGRGRGNGRGRRGVGHQTANA